MPKMPENIAADEYQAEVWRSVTASGRFTDEDMPNLVLLCFWHSVAKAAEDAMSKGKSVKVLDQVGYKPMKARNGRRAIMERPHPAVTVLKQATAEIRALNDTLGLSRKSVPASSPAPARPQSEGAKVLALMFDDRERKAKAAGA